MSTIGFYSKGKLLNTSTTPSVYLDQRYDKIEKEAQDLADECGCQIDAWPRTDEGEQKNRTGITAFPQGQVEQG